MNSFKPIMLIENNDNDAKDIKTALNDIHVTNVLDLNMPRMGAFEFINTLKNDHILKRIPIIALMSSETNGEVARSSGLDIAGYISKPFDYKQFIEVMRALDIHWALNRKEDK